MDQSCRGETRSQSREEYGAISCTLEQDRLGEGGEEVGGLDVGGQSASSVLALISE